jgi:hypothetical protein
MLHPAGAPESVVLRGGFENRITLTATRRGAREDSAAMKRELTESEVISGAGEGIELQEEYFHSRQDLHHILRELGFDPRVESRPVEVERRRTGR